MSSLLVVALVILLIATVASLAGGLAAMAIGGETDARHSEHMMFARVAWQGAALLLLVVWLYLHH
ncbi:MAG: HIG1 domain-containing protein [Proteobacteria bacterium]|nr:HIG1 domain-containing protein [Pseudomonadota bacterium]MBS0465363.1 HIG1 domain-containing protein [Pseudomonadota bacterium]